jgi:formate hydrogenlyase transcriptional activator
MISSPESAHHLQRLHRLATHVGATRDLVGSLQSIVALVHESGAIMSHVCMLTTDDNCPRCRSAAIREGRTSEQRLHFVARAGTQMEPDSVHIFPPGWGMVGEVVRTRQPLRLVHNADAIVREELLETPLRYPETGLRVEHVMRFLESDIQTVAFFPLISRDILLGVLCSSFSRPVDDNEFTWLSLCASTAASAIERAHLRERLQELQTVRPTPRRLAAVPPHKARERETEHEMVGESAAFRALMDTVDRAASSDSTVLISGETGTGKELVARAIHRMSRRAHHPLVSLNCGAVSPHLIESELFGHERGAFTGALQRRIGRFEAADHGTMLLDELSELPPDAQVKLLRVLQEREFERVGSSHTVRVDFRLIAATNRELEDEVAAGRFRQDLLYRVNVLPIRVPSLRERRDDIPLFVRYFIDHFHHTFDTPARDITSEALEMLEQYDWPGNVRELRNVIERACVLASGTIITVSDVRLPSPKRAHLSLRPIAFGDSNGNGHVPVAAEELTTYEEHERKYLRRVLTATNWRVDGPRGAAAILGMNPSTLRSRLQRLGIRRIEHASS